MSDLQTIVDRVIFAMHGHWRDNPISARSLAAECGCSQRRIRLAVEELTRNGARIIPCASGYWIAKDPEDALYVRRAAVTLDKHQRAEQKRVRLMFKIEKDLLAKQEGIFA
jgi:biotin operon repressor